MAPVSRSPVPLPQPLLGVLEPTQVDYPATLLVNVLTLEGADPALEEAHCAELLTHRYLPGSASRGLADSILRIAFSTRSRAAASSSCDFLRAARRAGKERRACCP